MFFGSLGGRSPGRSEAAPDLIVRSDRLPGQRRDCRWVKQCRGHDAPVAWEEGTWENSKRKIFDRFCCIGKGG